MGDHKIYNVTMIINPERLSELISALQKIGVRGMMVTHIEGCGAELGAVSASGGSERDVCLLPKTKVEVIGSQIPVGVVIDTAKNVLQTGHIGDGKIFVYDVENVVKVRTGEEGYDALQDVE